MNLNFRVIMSLSSIANATKVRIITFEALFTLHARKWLFCFNVTQQSETTSTAVTSHDCWWLEICMLAESAS